MSDTAGLPKPTAGPGATDVEPAATPGTPDVVQAQAGTEVQALQGQVAQLQNLLEEQRRIQGGLDKTKDQLQAERDRLDQEKTNLDAEVKRLNDVLMSDGDVKSRYEQDLAGFRAKHEKELATVRAELVGAQEQTGQLQQQIGALQEQNERLRIVAAEFTQLVPLLEANALPQAANLDEFRQKLDTLAGQLTSTADAQTLAKARGARPPTSPPASPQVDEEKLKEDLRTAAREGDWEEYDRVKKQWYAIPEEA